MEQNPASIRLLRDFLRVLGRADISTKYASAILGISPSSFNSWKEGGIPLHAYQRVKDTLEVLQHLCDKELLPAPSSRLKLLGLFVLIKHTFDPQAVADIVETYVE